MGNLQGIKNLMQMSGVWFVSYADFMTWIVCGYVLEALFGPLEGESGVPTDLGIDVG